MISNTLFPSDFVFLTNENNRYIGPSWCVHLSGMKFENWMRSSNPDWMTWWDWFYGLTPPWEPGDNWGVGYAWTEAVYDRPTADRLKGWDLSFIEVWDEPDRPQADNLRQMRLGLGTAMLGDGYFTFTRDQRHPLWQREFDWDFGEPLGPFTRETPSRADTLYVRLFGRGMVEVNPNAWAVSEVPAQDSRFTFWLPVQDLERAGDARTRRPRGMDRPHRGGKRRRFLRASLLDDTDLPGQLGHCHAVRGESGRRESRIEPWPSRSSACGPERSTTSPSGLTRAAARSRSFRMWYRCGRRRSRTGFTSRIRHESIPIRSCKTTAIRAGLLRSLSVPGFSRSHRIRHSMAHRIRFAIATGTGPFRLTVESVTGQRVRRLIEGAARPGAHAWTWDGIDDRGNRVAAGAYFVRLSWRGGSDGGKILIVR